MGYRTSNTAHARDMQPHPYAFDGNAARDLAFAQLVPQAPLADPRPNFDVVTGAGREADQVVSPAFMHVMKLFFAVALLFCALSGARVVLAGYTSATLDDNATLIDSLETARDESSTLEVSRSVYGSKTRVRDLASSMLGMVEGTDGVTVDISDSDTEDTSTDTSEDADVPDAS